MKEKCKTLEDFFLVKLKSIYIISLEPGCLRMRKEYKPDRMSKHL